MLSHKRVVVYRVTHNEHHNNFLISPNLIYEDILMFIYSDSDNKTVRKLIPLKAIGPYLKVKKFFKYDDERVKFKGMAYEIPAEFVFFYKHGVLV